MYLMGKRPSFQFYPGDWLRDNVAGCSLMAQGLWLRIIFLMFDSDRFGFLSQKGSPIPSESIARRCGCTLEEYTVLLQELFAAGVPEMTADRIIYCRRMARDEKERQEIKCLSQKRSRAGKLGAISRWQKPSKLKATQGNLLTGPKPQETKMEASESSHKRDGKAKAKNAPSSSISTSTSSLSNSFSTLGQSLNPPDPGDPKVESYNHSHSVCATPNNKSRFSLETIRNYAWASSNYTRKLAETRPSYRVEGIRNAEGFAIKAFRTGEFDELIQDWIDDPSIFT
jgi:hypothetical protein